jgi:fumarylacetoacetate (FAA) hydrolase family protein
MMAFRCQKQHHLSGLSRGFAALVDALFDQHDYPDGVFAFTGSPIAPTWDSSVLGWVLHTWRVTG